MDFPLINHIDYLKNIYFVKTKQNSTNSKTKTYYTNTYLKTYNKLSKDLIYIITIYFLNILYHNHLYIIDEMTLIIHASFFNITQTEKPV